MTELAVKRKFELADSSKVFVPAKNPNAKTDWGQFLGTTAQILGSIVTIVLVVQGTK